MPQTREHLAIVEQLRIGRGIPVITKVDLVDADWLQLLTGEISAWLGGLAGRVRASGGDRPCRGTWGSTDLRDRLRSLTTAATGTADDLFRLPVDRAFSVAGIGTVVTGTTWSGTRRVGRGGPDPPRGPGGQGPFDRIARAAPSRPARRVAAPRSGSRGGTGRGAAGGFRRPARRRVGPDYRALDVELELLPGARPRSGASAPGSGSTLGPRRCWPGCIHGPQSSRGQRGLARLALESAGDCAGRRAVRPSVATVP